MKQKDIALIIVIAFISAILSFFVSGKVFVTSQNKQIQVPQADAINDRFLQPSSKYFNAQSIDPTQEVQIGNNSNQNPFNGTNQ